MPTVSLTLPHHRYDIVIEPGALAQLGAWVKPLCAHERAAILADQAVLPLYGARAKRALEAAGFEVLLQGVAGGEEEKNLQTVSGLYDVLVRAKWERQGPVMALGGGVIGDTAGFVASTYLRGVPFVQCPTTLLAMVDASVGGKVGVNLPLGKNLVGSFYQPRLVAIDPLTLQTLPARELRCGLAECVKHAVIREAQRFDWLETNLEKVQRLEPDTLTELVRWNVQIKANVVMADEKETGERAHLNFGHTFAHAIEATTHYGHYHHGEAVSLGMVAATFLATQNGRCAPELLPRLVSLLQRIGLPTSARDLPPTDTLMESMKLDKKVAAGRVRLVLPLRMGAVSIIKDTPDEAVRQAWEALRG